MKLTLELGMLIICVVLLFVLVVFQYTNITNEDDTEEGFRSGNIRTHCFEPADLRKLLECSKNLTGKECVRLHYTGRL